MPKKQSLKDTISLFAANFIVLLIADRASAFTLKINQSQMKYKSPGYIYNDYITQKTYEGFTLATVPTKEGVKPGGSQGLWSRLNAFSIANSTPKERWQFINTGQSYSGQLNINFIMACGYNQPCGSDTTMKYGVGMDIDMVFFPPGNNPNVSNLRWIQWVRSNHEINSLHGTPENQLDIDYESAIISPFYYNRSLPTFGFSDTPYRNDPQNWHKWTAELYIASVTKQGNTNVVKIYDGIKWGWSNFAWPVKQFCPAKATGGSGAGKCPPPPPPPYCNGNSGGGGCNKNHNGIFTYEIANQEQLVLDSNDPNGIEDQELLFSDTGAPFESPESIPEPTSALALLALGAWGIIQKLTNSNSKQQ